MLDVNLLEGAVAIHFSDLYHGRDRERQMIQEAIRDADPIGADADEIRWYVAGDEPEDGVHVYVAMNDKGTTVVTAFGAASLADRIRSAARRE